jgi:hypothetical protein
MNAGLQRNQSRSLQSRRRRLLDPHVMFTRIWDTDKPLLDWSIRYKWYCWAEHRCPWQIIFSDFKPCLIRLNRQGPTLYQLRNMAVCAACNWTDCV